LCERFTELALPFQKLSGDIENHLSITGYKEWKELIIVYLDDIIINSDTI
jgi:hypothetical protein